MLGLYIFETKLWPFTKKHRDGNVKRDEKFPQYRRYDAEKWARWKFYPGAMFMMPTRFVCMMSSILTLVFVTHCCCLGHDFKKGPVKG